MSRTSISVALFLALVSSAPLFACLWDSDTLQMERLRFPGVLEIITGKFVRHSRAYYEWRIGDRQRKLLTKPGDPALIDDLAVAYAKLGRPEEGIPLLKEVLKQHPDRYETLSNLGTLLFFAGRLDDSKTYIRRALEVNPDAHFGREKYQLLLTEYLQQSKHDKFGVMSIESREPAEFGHKLVGFARFTRERSELRNATKGVLGMMHFADFQSPILLEALGDLLLEGSTQQDAAQHACRAYLRAAESSGDVDAKKTFRRMAEETLVLTQGIDFRQIEKVLGYEVADGKTWFAEIAANEAKWIAGDADVDHEFAANYYDSLESTIKSAEKEVAPILARAYGPSEPEGPPIPSAVIPLENTWIAPLIGTTLAITLLLFVAYFKIAARSRGIQHS